MSTIAIELKTRKRFILVVWLILHWMVTTYVRQPQNATSVAHAQPEFFLKIKRCYGIWLFPFNLCLIHSRMKVNRAENVLCHKHLEVLRLTSLRSKYVTVFNKVSKLWFVINSSWHQNIITWHWVGYFNSFQLVVNACSERIGCMQPHFAQLEFSNGFTCMH